MKKHQFKTIKRLLKYVTKNYKFQFIIVLISIIVSAVVGVLGAQFIKYLIDDIITPLLSSDQKDFTSLIQMIFLILYAAQNILLIVPLSFFHLAGFS